MPGPHKHLKVRAVFSPRNGWNRKSLLLFLFHGFTDYQSVQSQSVQQVIIVPVMSAVIVSLVTPLSTGSGLTKSFADFAPLCVSVNLFYLAL